MLIFAQKPKAVQQTKSVIATKSNQALSRQDLNVHSILHLQRTIGNQAVLRLLKTDLKHLENGACTANTTTRFAHGFSQYAKTPIKTQTKLTVSTPGDIYEQEADRVTDQVMRMPDPRLERACACDGECPKYRNEQSGQQQLQTTPIQGHDAGETTASPLAHEVASSGQPLDSTTRGFMESRFGHDLSMVRVHTDARASETARALNARVYTLGRNVVFGAGQYAPRTHVGKSLLAHELTHVLQQGARNPLLQRKPDEKAQSMGDLELPWKHGDYSLFEEKIAGIRFLVGVSSDKAAESAGRVIPAIGKRIAEDNSRIKEPSSRVMTCFIVPTTTRFALWEGKPVLMLDSANDPSNVSAETAAHEMGHAIFYALEIQAESKTKDAAKAGNFRLIVADIYVRLSQTKDFTEGNETLPAGLWIADPSQWVPGGKKEHPCDDPDEFFASAKEAYQVNRKGFESAIARFKKIDPAVGRPAKELLDLLDAFFKRGKLPSKGLSGARASTAKRELERATGVSKVEDTIMSDTLLDWLLNPGNRPKQQEARPSIESPY